MGFRNWIRDIGEVLEAPAAPFPANLFQGRPPEQLIVIWNVFESPQREVVKGLHGLDIASSSG
ncbi:MAG: hypothetical protein LBF74_12455 [Treponema sp.]|nr:hypothetical protein [Treponema sp.]